MNISQWIEVFGRITVLCPCLLFLLIGLRLLVGRPMSESMLGRSLKVSVGISLINALAVLAIMLATGSRREWIDIGNMVVIHDVHFKPGVNPADFLDLQPGAVVREIEIALRGQLSNP